MPFSNEGLMASEGWVSRLTGCHEQCPETHGFYQRYSLQRKYSMVMRDQAAAEAAEIS